MSGKIEYLGGKKNQSETYSERDIYIDRSFRNLYSRVIELEQSYEEMKHKTDHFKEVLCKYMLST